MPGGGITCSGTGCNTGGGKIANTGGTTGRGSEDGTPTVGSKWSADTGMKESAIAAI